MNINFVIRKWQPLIHVSLAKERFLRLLADRYSSLQLVSLLARHATSSRGIPRIFLVSLEQPVQNLLSPRVQGIQRPRTLLYGESPHFSRKPGVMLISGQDLRLRTLHRRLPSRLRSPRHAASEIVCREIRIPLSVDGAFSTRGLLES